MFNSIRGLFFGVDVDGYSGVEGDTVANTLRTTATDDEWLLVDEGGEHTPAPPIVADPMENLFIEHPSMSVYVSLRPRTARNTSTESSERAQQVAPAHPAPPNRVCLSNRTECYNLRKMSMQKARSSKKQTTRKAFHHLNQTTHYPKHVGRSVCRSTVFQPRK